jgi:hypothetical protein
MTFHLMACVWIVLGKCNDPDNVFYCGEDDEVDNVVGWVEYDRKYRGDEYGIS